ncbi:TerC family protein [Cytophaga hutchinsonii]|jgi:predicted tellurium resistance membrane protein TerC|uniref:Membrane protein, TerC family n=1 Tax=Cytophaga hutchinsonii (strain ATCC 33406 / DSM 1761 / CIP 103989 / NBRC 15051 / NCIMB 9469 / D465) TaxID=269798 RepID=A0A6N4SXC9_CYTH3|nr:TerC family protein [Cytophaga hutchinsonii]ABG60969.1 membrane protein, TerC family [Cytophaga hutchinsonii ATCC 33406]SFX43470.1 Membrane protein TerC, possibly involved in tellurium resistance [Cytophaga hutchinsonii ATCC 33406]
MFDAFLTLDGWMSLLTLTIMEIVLGIDNVIFISIISDKLNIDIQSKARFIGLSGALIIRIILLSFITYLVGMDESIFTLFDIGFSWRDLILIAGGLFLVYKSTSEIYEKMEGHVEIHEEKINRGLSTAVMQIILLDVVFSFDSILTAVGLSNHIEIMVIAVVISMIVMLVFAKTISDFINKHPSVKVLALAFLLMIGILLIAEGFDQHVPKGYIYFSMFFSLLVEAINMYSNKRNKTRENIEKAIEEEQQKIEEEQELPKK